MRGERIEHEAGVRAACSATLEDGEDRLTQDFTLLNKGPVAVERDDLGGWLVAKHDGSLLLRRQVARFNDAMSAGDLPIGLPRLARAILRQDQ